MGVLLSGNLNDGVEGLREIKRHGGLTIVQDPAEARFPAMPRNALAAMEIDHCMPVGQIHDLMTSLPDLPRIPMANAQALPHAPRCSLHLRGVLISWIDGNVDAGNSAPSFIAGCEHPNFPAQKPQPCMAVRNTRTARLDCWGAWSPLNVEFIRLLFADPVEEEIAHRWALRFAALIGAQALQLRPRDDSRGDAPMGGCVER